MRKKPNILLITTDYQAWEDNPVDLPFLDMPATTGREIRDTAGSVAVGRSINGPDCIPLLSDTPDDDTYTATITDVKLNLLNH